MKPAKAMAQRAVEVQTQIEKFLAENTFVCGELQLEMTYNPWHAKNGAKPYTYYLRKGSSGQSAAFTFEELNGLKAFLNSIKLVEA